MATGRRNSLRLELNGTAGSLAFDFEAMNELSFYDATGPRRTNGFRRIIATEPDHPYMSAWWPPGHGLGYDHTFTNEIADFVRAIVEGSDPEPSLLEGLQVQRVLAALESSATSGGAWTIVDGAER
jgi:predicted dehydrogenase